MKIYLTAILLCAAITLIAFGVQTSNPILACIGGLFAGIYNAMIYYKKD